jgi:streptomycin 6-kinase
LAAFAAGKSVNSVPAWEYVQGNIAASAGHYYQLAKLLDDIISSYDPATRVSAVEKALDRSAKLAKQLRSDKNIETGLHTDLNHQEVWHNAFRKWREYSGL